MIAPEKAFTTDFLTEWISKTATPVNVTQILSTRLVTLPILFYLPCYGTSIVDGHCDPQVLS